MVAIGTMTEVGDDKKRDNGSWRSEVVPVEEVLDGGIFLIDRIF